MRAVHYIRPRWFRGAESALGALLVRKATDLRSLRVTADRQRDLRADSAIVALAVT